MNPSPEVPASPADEGDAPFAASSAPGLAAGAHVPPGLPLAGARPATSGEDPDAPISLGRKVWRVIATRQFLFASILVHLLFGGMATVFIVQTVTAKRKLTFTSAPPAPAKSTHSIEHQVQIAQKQKTMGAPAQSKRVTTVASNTKVALPPMPDMPAVSDLVTPVKMAGLGGVGFGMGSASGNGNGTGGGGGGVPLFGLRTGGKGLVGHLYDLKQDRNRQPTGMTEDKYPATVLSFVRGGFNPAALSKYYQASVSLYTTQLFMPSISATLAPKEFGVEAEVQPRLWIAVYQGKVTPPESGTYHFVGMGDDVLVVRFDGKVVLDRGYTNVSGYKAAAHYYYKFDVAGEYNGPEHGHGVGSPLEVTAGSSHDIQILIGERPGGDCMFQLLLQKDGVEYQKDPSGNPILPVFRMADAKVPENSSKYPPHREDGPIWKGEPNTGTSSIFGN